MAQHAELAVGTLYRHFPTRAALVDAIVAERLQAWADVGAQALAVADPWRGFVLYLERICELQAADRAFNDIACQAVLNADGAAEASERIHEQTRDVLERAKEAGALRPDFTLEDLSFVVWANSRVTEATHSIRPTLWRRYFALMLDALRAQRAHDLAEPPLQAEELTRALWAFGNPGS